MDWKDSKTINRVVLYDRPGLDEHTAGGTLIFSDGSEIPVTQISNDGAPKTIEFEPKTVKWVKFRGGFGNFKRYKLRIDTRV